MEWREISKKLNGYRDNSPQSVVSEYRDFLEMAAKVHRTWLLRFFLRPT